MKKKQSFAVLLLCCSMLFACGGDSKKTARSADSSALVSPEAKMLLSCTSEPSNEQLTHLRGLIAEIYQRTSIQDICEIPYQPLTKCTPKMINEECSFIFEDIAAYLKEEQAALQFCITDTDDWYAAVNANSSTPKIYVSTAFLKEGEDEQIRSLIHELNHLQGNHKPHTEDKTQCVYFENDALRAEHCMTCKVTLSPIKLSNCNSENGIFIIKK